MESRPVWATSNKRVIWVTEYRDELGTAIRTEIAVTEGPHGLCIEAQCISGNAGRVIRRLRRMYPQAVVKRCRSLFDKRQLLLPCCESDEGGR
jgi:methyl coenzyme M reductase subunit C-like uncharacterized protein (methanogenesis marker protein 7)